MLPQLPEAVVVMSIRPLAAIVAWLQHETSPAGLPPAGSAVNAA
jgi:hypothetical protein